MDNQIKKIAESGDMGGYNVGSLLDFIIFSARIQDREGTISIIDRIKNLYPKISTIYANGGYAGEKLKALMEHHKDLVLQIVERSHARQGFVVLPKRWFVERTIAWLDLY